MEDKKKKRKFRDILVYIVLFISSIIIVGSLYYVTFYTRQDFDVIIFTLSEGVVNASPDVIKGIIITCLPTVLILTGIFILPIRKQKNSANNIKDNNKKKNKEQNQNNNNDNQRANNEIMKRKNIILIKLSKFFSKLFSKVVFKIKQIIEHRGVYATIIGILSIIVYIRCFRVDEFIINSLNKTTIFEDYYVDARSVNIEFPEQKRNLILILGESFENTVFSKENGGSWDESIMPELEQLSLENINFSNTEKLGGAVSVYGTTYSAAGNVAITSGAPLKAQELGGDKNVYSGKGQYLSGLYTLGEILSEHDYNLEIMMGSEGTFGGRKQYYTTNGNYKVYDVNYAIEKGKMKEEDKVWWGFDDDDLYKWSEEEITNLAKEDKPFNYIMLTADTHFSDGYLSENVGNKYETQYENVYAYSSKCIKEFVEWIKKQDFYENTTIVILGDHLGMQNDFYEKRMTSNYKRTICNVIMNSTNSTKNTKNRQFTSMDMYPTILASIGVKIDGDRLGLGTNLFSDMPTLIEELGYDYFNGELKKTSEYYNKYILGDDYYLIRKIKVETGEEEG